MVSEYKKLAGKKFLITGGAGFIGSNLTRKLLDYGADITIFVRDNFDKYRIEDIKNKIKIINGDLTSENDVKQAIENKDYMFHLAWNTDLKLSMSHPKEDINEEIIGLINILELCRKNNPDMKIIFSSTVTVIGKTSKEDLPINEKKYGIPLSIYEANKLSAENYLMMYNNVYNLKTCILRFSNVFGEWQRIDNPSRGVLNFMIGRALRGETLNVYGTGNFIRDYCYVQNYIDAMILAALSENTNGEVYIIGSGEGRNFNEIVKSIKRIVEENTKKEVKIDNIPWPDEENEINKRDFIADFSKFNKATGWIPKISFDDGLRKVIKFYQNENKL